MPEPVKLIRVEALDKAITASLSAADQAHQATSDVQASATLIEQAANMGRVADEAALAGKPAGNYELIASNERVTWDGAAITARGPMLATATQVQTVGGSLSNTALAQLASKGKADGVQFVDGSRWLWGASGVLDGGTVVASSDKGYWHREYYGGVRPEWFGAVGDEVHDDTAALNAAMQAVSNGLVTLAAGRSYRITAPIHTGAKIIRLYGEGVTLLQMLGEPHGDFRRESTARIFADYVATDANSAALSLEISGSIIENIEIQFNTALHPVTTPKVLTPNWQPTETGYAIRSGSGRQIFRNIIIRGFRYGIDASNNGSMTTFENIYLGVYDLGIKVDNAFDTVRMRGIHQSLWHLPSVWDSWTEVAYMLEHLTVLQFGRLDNPIIGDVLCLACYCGLMVTGNVSKATFGRFETDESINGVIVKAGYLDAQFESLIYQRFPEGTTVMYGTYNTRYAGQGFALYSMDAVGFDSNGNKQPQAERDRVRVGLLHITNLPDVAVNIGGYSFFSAREVYSPNQHAPYFYGRASTTHLACNSRSIDGPKVQIFAGDAIWHGQITRQVAMPGVTVPKGYFVDIYIAVGEMLPAAISNNYGGSLTIVGASMIYNGLVCEVISHNDRGKARVIIRNVTGQDISLSDYTAVISVNSLD